jgi:urease accessory protein
LTPTTSDPTGVPSAFLLLADARIPTGSYAHSGGIEAAVADGRVSSIDDLERYLRGRISTTGLCDASLAAAAHGERRSLRAIAAEAAARCPSPTLRAASRTEARGLLRAARAMWPSIERVRLVETAGSAGPMWPVALGVVAGSLDLDRHHAALAAAQASISGPAWSAIRLLGLDPFAVAGLLATLAPTVDATASHAAAQAARASSWGELPALTTPLQEIAAEEREHWEVRLFVS